jgi:peptidoglycan/xylan/chitin deacetylase (PgdA/CDA1 family)
MAARAPSIRASLRRSASSFSRSRPFAWAVRSLERLDPPARHVLPVLMYHRIGEAADEPTLDPRLLSATPPEFEEQMEFLAARRRVVSLHDLLGVRDGEAELPPRPVLVTFDDAARDFAEHAWPTLRRLGLPVTVFVPTAYPDGAASFWWDRLHAAVTATRRPALATPDGTLSLATDADRAHALARLQEAVRALPHGAGMALVDDVARQLQAPPAPPTVLGWDELRRLAGEGVTLAPHTRTHPYLDRVKPGEARAEIEGSMRDLEREVGSCPPAFAYPAGACSAAVVGVLAELGVRVAFTTERGSNDLRRADWLRLKRINVGRRSTVPLLRAELLSLPASARPPWRARPRKRPSAAGAV